MLSLKFYSWTNDSSNWVVHIKKEKKIDTCITQMRLVQLTKRAKTWRWFPKIAMSHGKTSPAIYWLHEKVSFSEETAAIYLACFCMSIAYGSTTMSVKRVKMNKTFSGQLSLKSMFEKTLVCSESKTIAPVMPKQHLRIHAKIVDKIKGNLK